MANREIFGVALERFRTHPVQTALTLIGMVVGTAAIVLVVALGLTGRRYVMNQIEAVGSHLVWASYRGTLTAGVSREIDDHIDEGDVRAIAGRPDLFTGVTPIVLLRGNVTVQSRVKTLTVIGTTSNYGRVRRNLRILRGRFLDEGDVQERSKVCVVNRPLYRDLFGNDDSPAKTVRAMGMSFQVIGIFEEPVDTLGQGDVTPETVFVPITVAWFFTPTRRVDRVFAEVREFDKIPVAVATVEDLLRDRHRPGSVYEVESMRSVIRVARAISSGLIVLFVLAAAISVVVGGVGIMNILLAAVEQRTREIGLRKSVGARRADILTQFLFEALLLGAAGASLGVLVGLGLPLVARTVVKGVEVQVSTVSAVFAFLFSCTVAVLFGVVPAWRAAALDPTEALHHE